MLRGWTREPHRYKFVYVKSCLVIRDSFEIYMYVDVIYYRFLKQNYCTRRKFWTRRNPIMSSMTENTNLLAHAIRPDCYLHSDSRPCIFWKFLVNPFIHSSLVRPLISSSWPVIREVPKVQCYLNVHSSALSGLCLSLFSYEVLNTALKFSQDVIYRFLNQVCCTR